MKKYFRIIFIEFNHFINSPFKVFSLIFYAMAIIYGCYNGYDLFKKYNEEIVTINSNKKIFIEKMTLEYEEIEMGKIEKPRRDPTTPYWAIRNTASNAIKYPSSMMTFSIGQSEQYGYYKKITNCSTVFDSDLAQEIANPERLAIGTLDFSFVFIYLTPILMIILLFNIGGFEIDLGFNKLIYLSNISRNKWLLFRFIFYYISIMILILSLIIPYSLLSGVFINEFIQFFKMLLIISLYTLLWFTIFYFINIFGNGSSDQAIKMISTWLAICIIIPGTIHQITSIKYPINYMTEYIDVNRDKSNDIFDLSHQTLRQELLDSFPDLQNTIYASDTSLNKNIINRSLSGLINILNKNIASEILKSNEDKNKFINSFNKINPVTFFQNTFNHLANTDYDAYNQYRNQIQLIIDKQIVAILLDTWNKVVVDKERYHKYVESFKL